MPERRRNARRSIVGIVREKPRDRLLTNPDDNPFGAVREEDLRVSNMARLR